jgi:PEP-CTERM motif
MTRTEVLGRMTSALTLAMMIAAVAAPAVASPLVFSVGGTADPSSIQPTVDAFRAALGDPNNANAPGPLNTGRREINWDGGGSTANSPGGSPFDVFLNTRGAQFLTDGTGFVQAPPEGGMDGGLEAFFGNPTYGDTFGVFSPARVFTPVGSNHTEGRFFVPGTAGGVPAEVSGFGAVFTDVDVSADTTEISFFDRFGNLLTEQVVPAGTVADRSLSFLGVIFDAGEKIARVEITTGTAPLGPNDDPDNGIDVVVMDDFLFSEPRQVPEPTTLALLGAGAILLAGVRGHLRRASKTR